MHPHAAAAVAALALALAGCATVDRRRPGRQDSGDGPVTLKFQSLAFQESTVKATKKIVDAWNAANPDIQVEYVQGSWDSVQDQLVTQFQGGTAPDIIQYESAAMTAVRPAGLPRRPHRPDRATTSRPRSPRASGRPSPSTTRSSPRRRCCRATWSSPTAACSRTAGVDDPDRRHLVVGRLPGRGEGDHQGRRLRRRLGSERADRDHAEPGHELRRRVLRRHRRRRHGRGRRRRAGRAGAHPRDGVRRQVARPGHR